MRGNGMKRTVVWIAAAMSLLTGAAARADMAPPIVRTDAGQVAGVATGGVTAFRNIPYAAAPVGELRWRPPQPVTPWSGVRSGSAYGPICMQVYPKGDNGVGPLPMSEDCLSLNVFTPDLKPGSKAAVMVWIHGGGFVNGSGTAALYDGSALARQGVVVVTLNYRLGRFGFFAHPALSKEAGAGPVANYGLMDQIAALEWVKRNIAAFGGNPSNVTIFGESAGGVSVNRLLVAEPAQGLFSKAIVESGLGGETPTSLADAQAQGAAFAARLGVGDGDLKGLRALPAAAIIGAGEPNPMAGFGPINDGLYVTGRVDALFAAGRQARVPLIIGSNAAEFFWVRADRQSPFPMPADALAALKAAYGDPEAYAANVFSDALFTEPARFTAQAAARAGQPVWLYRFSVLSELAPKSLPGTPHAQERQYVFRTLSTSPWPTTANDETQAALVSAYWVAFAKAGDPNGDGRPVWPGFTGDGGGMLINFTNGGPVVEMPKPEGALDAIAKVQAPMRAAP
jgi:para-nitrobenzyl esterase